MGFRDAYEEPEPVSRSEKRLSPAGQAREIETDPGNEANALNFNFDEQRRIFNMESKTTNSLLCAHALLETMNHVDGITYACTRTWHTR
ncbi:hypothetical protein NDU88_003961 [Pleurodeles waltl]|uniref:Uncharacterized protein n=1 Tax=Pleurodeles waltl TaxID=8319 RepID=A0AAV7KWG0_PLEWA|nr:hypothetical protein NDU88_003961 [Pleurodeles waltl]